MTTLTAYELLQLAITFLVNGIDRGRVTRLVWVVDEVGVDVTNLFHGLIEEIKGVNKDAIYLQKNRCRLRLVPCSRNPMLDSCWVNVLSIGSLSRPLQLFHSHFTDMSAYFAMNTRARNAMNSECMLNIFATCEAYQMKIPKLCDAHLGFLALQSAHTSDFTGGQTLPSSSMFGERVAYHFQAGRQAQAALSVFSPVQSFQTTSTALQLYDKEGDGRLNL